MTLDQAFDRLVAAAVAGERCPQNDAIPSRLVSTLARAGRVTVRVYVRNWRIVEIMTGPHRGLFTADDPLRRPGDKPYLVVSLESEIPRSAIPPDLRREPWKPGDPRPGKSKASA